MQWFLSSGISPSLFHSRQLPKDRESTTPKAASQAACFVLRTASLPRGTKQAKPGGKSHFFKKKKKGILKQ